MAVRRAPEWHPTDRRRSLDVSRRQRWHVTRYIAASPGGGRQEERNAPVRQKLLYVCNGGRCGSTWDAPPPRPEGPTARPDLTCLHKPRGPRSARPSPPRPPAYPGSSSGPAAAPRHGGAKLRQPARRGAPRALPRRSAPGRRAGTAPPAPRYEEPPWGSRPPAGAGYGLEVLKGGVALGSVRLEGGSWFLVGRLPGCALSLEHPSVSRHHAVLQYRGAGGSPDGPAADAAGFYVYDLGSTHGTFLNKARVPPRTYCRVRVGHGLRFGGSSRLFLLQGPEEDQESESELTVTQLKALRKQQRAKLEKTMLGEDSDEEEKEERNDKGQNSDMSCSWGMGEDAEEDEVEENPIAIDFQDVQDAFYMKDPRKALQGFFDREGEELEYEYDDRGHNSWLCRIKLPVDDASGKQLVAEVLHSGKKKEAMIQCALEACRLLDARGVLRQEAVSRKRKSKNWEDEDFYDSDDDTFLDRTGAVEKKRLNRMKKAGKIEEKPETYDSLVTKLKEAENELSEITEKLKASGKVQSQPAAQDSLDEFMTEIKSGCTLDSVARKKLHLRSFELKKEQQRLKGLIKLVKPAELPELKPQSGSYSLEAESKPKKITLPLFGAMKGGSKFKLKTGSLGKLPVKRPDIPESLLKMKDDGPEEEEEEEEEEMGEQQEVDAIKSRASNLEMKMTTEEETGKETNNADGSPCNNKNLESLQDEVHFQPEPKILRNKSQLEPSQEKSQASAAVCKEPEETPEKVKKINTSSKVQQPFFSSQYPDDDPDYCIWIPPAGQSGDGKTHLNEKYGY
ncbi:PREDICTED: kanadaptin [Calidris pugnax]|uniref:kanadaptin n=1 Tax=Calidris pugnax TaxID=198806 RepID=UPI00071C8600|nr:PREDICTED: kanadaptin [Calidris pugnax]